MIDRVCNSRCRAFKNYGGRGIHICVPWMEFEGFARDMAATFDADLELDRTDVNGNYCVENCRWTSRIEQQRNRRNNHRVIFDGREMTVQEWAEETSIKANTIITRLRRGWPVNKALEIANA